MQAAKTADKAIIFLDGYQSKYSGSNTTLVSSWLKRFHWQGAIYRLWWDAGSEDGMKYAMSPLGQIPVINQLVHAYPHWRMVVDRAEKSGREFFPSLVSSVREKQVSLMGYSLGCRVIHYGMLEFNPPKSPVEIDNIFLFAGAIRRIRWGRSANKISGNIYNFYNNNDDVLKNWFSHLGLYQNKPCGIAPIRQSHPSIQNIDLTHSLHTHSHNLEHYLKYLKSDKHLF